MSDYIKLLTRAAISSASLTQPSPEEQLHITIIHGPEIKQDFFSEKEIINEKDLTIIEVPSGEFGGSSSIYEYIQTSGLLLALSGVVVFGNGFLNRLGEIFAEKLMEKFSGHDLPSKIHLEYPNLSATIKITIPQKITKEQARNLNKLIAAMANGIKKGTYGEVYFSPESNALIPIYWREDV